MNKIQEVIAKCEQIYNEGKIPEIEAIAIGGSASFKHIDVHSDLDLLVLVNSCHDIASLRLLIRSLSTLVSEFTLFHGPQFIEGFGYSFLIICEPFLVCNFLVNDRTTLRPNPMQAQETPFIFDRTGYYSRYLRERKGMKIDEQQLFASAFAFFWFRAIRVWKDVKRGHIWFAIRHLSDVRDQVFVLQRIIHGCPPLGLNFLMPSKSIEQDLGVDRNEEFKKTMCIYSEQSIVEALIYCMEWFFNDAKMYISLHKLNYDREIEAASKIFNMVYHDLKKVS